LELAGVLAEFGRVAAKFLAKPSEADENQPFGAATFAGYFLWGHAIGAIVEENSEGRGFLEFVFGGERFEQRDSLDCDIFAEGFFRLRGESG